MTSLNTGQPMSSVPMVAAATVADVKLKCEATPKRYPTHCVSTRIWPVTITTFGAMYRHCCTSSVVQIPARNLGSGRMGWARVITARSALQFSTLARLSVIGRKDANPASAVHDNLNMALRPSLARVM